MLIVSRSVEKDEQKGWTRGSHCWRVGCAEVRCVCNKERSLGWLAGYYEQMKWFGRRKCALNGSHLCAADTCRGDHHTEQAPRITDVARIIDIECVRSKYKLIESGFTKVLSKTSRKMARLMPHERVIELSYPRAEPSPAFEPCLINHRTTARRNSCTSSTLSE